MAAHGPSNGTEGLMFLDEWCQRCRNDHDASHVPDSEADYGNGCVHLTRLYCEDGPFDFLTDEHAPGELAWDPRKLVCRWFDRCPCRDDPGWQPARPDPVDPNQGLLFDLLPDSPVTPGGVVIPHEPARVEVVSVGDWL